MPRHTIRLNSQWLPHDAPRHPPPASYFRLPATISLEDFQKSKPFLLQRHFHAPTGITVQTTVQLRIDIVAASAGVTFNGQPVLVDRHEPAQDGAAHDTLWFPVTSRLEAFNSLLVAINPDSTATPERLPAIIGAGLVIDEPAAVD